METLPKNEYRISITSGCNMKCVYCHNEGNCSFNQLSKEDIELLIKNSYDLGLTGVRLTGGEPLIHPNIVSICKMLHDEYNLKIGINTNGVEIDKLMFMINRGWIERVVVGLDYFDAPISKNSSIGLSSKEIKNNIIRIKNSGIRVSVATVYDGDYENIKNILNWCIENDIRLKVVEQVDDKVCESTSSNYLDLMYDLMRDFNLELKTEPMYKEIYGELNGKNVVAFFHSHCRLRECDLCKNMHLRVGADGKLRSCLLFDDDAQDFRKGNVRDNIIRALKKEVNYHL